MANVNPQFDSIPAVATRMGVSIRWIVVQLNLQDQSSIPGDKQLTKQAIQYLEYCKGDTEQEYMAPPSRSEIFVKSVPLEEAVETPKKDEILKSHLYTREVRINGMSVVETDNVIIHIQDLQTGEWKPRVVLKSKYFGMIYYCASISVHPFGVKLHHVWGIFAE